MLSLMLFMRRHDYITKMGKGRKGKCRILSSNMQISYVDKYKESIGNPERGFILFHLLSKGFMRGIFLGPIFF